MAHRTIKSSAMTPASICAMVLATSAAIALATKTAVVFSDGRAMVEASNFTVRAGEPTTAVAIVGADTASCVVSTPCTCFRLTNNAQRIVVPALASGEEYCTTVVASVLPTAFSGAYTPPECEGDGSTARYRLYEAMTSSMQVQAVFCAVACEAMVGQSTRETTAATVGISLLAAAGTVAMCLLYARHASVLS